MLHVDWRCCGFKGCAGLEVRIPLRVERLAGLSTSARQRMIDEEKLLIGDGGLIVNGLLIAEASDHDSS